MNKKLSLLLAGTLIIVGLNAFAAQPSLQQEKDLTIDEKTIITDKMDTETIYYPNATMQSAIGKYKNGNYSGCLQELFSLTKQDPSNALAYYYMAMAFTYVDMQDEAISAYEKVLALNPNEYLVEYATKGRDCLTGGPTCSVEDTTGETDAELDEFINAPYGNGLSPEINQENTRKELMKIKHIINKKQDLEVDEIQKIKDFDDKNSLDTEKSDKIAQVSDEEILNAVKTLKKAGLNLTLQSENPYSQMMQYQDPRMMEMSMLLGNNNNNANSMMNMLPMLMSQHQKGENMDPRFIQAMMMNSMMSDFSFTNDNNRY